jgi:hypothetical protein
MNPTVTSPENPTATTSGKSDLSRRGRRIRIAVTLVVAAVLLFGTLWGQDDIFPFGPFRMYASADKLNAPVADTRFELVDTTGATVELTQDNTGIRRAEIEGQLARFKADPALLRVIDEAYVSRNPHAPVAVTVRIIVRWEALKGGVPTGAYQDQTVATWNPPGAAK